MRYDGIPVVVVVVVGPRAISPGSRMSAGVSRLGGGVWLRVWLWPCLFFLLCDWHVRVGCDGAKEGREDDVMHVWCCFPRCDTGGRARVVWERQVSDGAQKKGHSIVMVEWAPRGRWRAHAPYRLRRLTAGTESTSVVFWCSNPHAGSLAYVPYSVCRPSPKRRGHRLVLAGLVGTFWKAIYPTHDLRPSTISISSKHHTLPCYLPQYDPPPSPS
jgi:hypothetical protein